MTTLKRQINIITQAFLAGLKDILDKKLYGVYIYGAATFPKDTLPTGDIDFHVILKSKLTSKEKVKLEKFHKKLAEKYPPLGDLDGYYILLKDAIGKLPPKSQLWKKATDNSWALHRQHILTGRYVALFGPSPKKIYLPATWKEIETALYKELDYIKKHLKDYPDYCILNLCRLIYSFETKNVAVSKAETSNWAKKDMPEWKKHIKLARKSYSGQATAGDKQFMLDQVEKFLKFAERRIK